MISPKAEIAFGVAISAPLAEETAKGMILVVVFVPSYAAARRFGGLEFSGVTDGIVYGAAVGLGLPFGDRGSVERLRRRKRNLKSPEVVELTDRTESCAGIAAPSEATGKAIDE